MDQKQKKGSARDLTDLKARLGLAKPSEAPAPAGVPAPSSTPFTAPTPSAAPSAPFYQPAPPPGVVPPPGITPPPGMQPAQPAAAPPPDPRRDPFAPSPSAQPRVETIVDAGPPIEIPKEKKSHTKMFIALLVPAVIALGVGWACGRIFASRVMFNTTIKDAASIQKEVQEISKINTMIAEILHKSRVRNEGKITYDEKLVEELKDVLRKSPSANAEKAKKRQDKLFKTNYALMEGIVIERLFQYYNNTIRLMAELEAFIRSSDSTVELLKSYASTADDAQRKYGIVFAEDKGKYFLAQLVEVGDIVCTNKKAKECQQSQIEGFMVRTGLTGSWTPRPGKPEKDQRITDIVIPIIPDENWRQVAIGKRGYLAYKDYVMRYGRLAALAALLARDEKALVKDLGKAAGREQLFVFGS